MAVLFVVSGLLLGAWCYRNIWHPPPQLEGCYGNQYAFLLWIGVGVAIVLLVIGGVSVAGVSIELAANPPVSGG